MRRRANSRFPAGMTERKARGGRPVSPPLKTHHNDRCASGPSSAAAEGPRKSQSPAPSWERAGRETRATAGREAGATFGSAVTARRACANGGWRTRLIGLALLFLADVGGMDGGLPPRRNSRFPAGMTARNARTDGVRFRRVPTGREADFWGAFPGFHPGLFSLRPYGTLSPPLAIHHNDRGAPGPLPLGTREASKGRAPRVV